MCIKSNRFLYSDLFNFELSTTRLFRQNSLKLWLKFMLEKVTK